MFLQATRILGGGAASAQPKGRTPKFLRDVRTTVDNCRKVGCSLTQGQRQAAGQCCSCSSH